MNWESWLVLSLVLCAIGLALRSMWRKRGRGECCGGSCSSCSACPHANSAVYAPSRQGKCSHCSRNDS